MPVVRLLERLREKPRDATGPFLEEEPNEVVYRLGLRGLAVPGLARSLTIGSVEVEFAPGPVRAQRTDIRQRHGLPVHFDKAMARPRVGKNELIAIFSIREAPVPDDLDHAFRMWRARALATAGMLAAVLDERVAGQEIFEDAVSLRDGRFVGGADVRTAIRTYLPSRSTPVTLRRSSSFVTSSFVARTSSFRPQDVR